MGEHAISINNLTKSYKTVHVLEGINLTVERGTILALLGPNGAGKTTTVRILSTLLQPDGGEVLVNGYNVVKDPDMVRRSIGLTGQYAAVDELLSGRENLEMMGRLYHLSKADSKDRAKELLQEFDLNDAAARAVKTYSGGMRRRLDLAASLIATPPILFLDEPTTGLDPRSRLAMWEVIKKLRKEGTTILLTTQQLEEADILADNIAVLDNGKIIAQGTANELKAKVGQDRLEVTMATEDDYQKAKLIAGADAQTSEAEKRISVPVQSRVKDVKRLLNEFENAGISVVTLSLHQPTLDDVFMELTGHEAENKQTGGQNE